MAPVALRHPGNQSPSTSSSLVPGPSRRTSKPTAPGLPRAPTSPPWPHPQLWVLARRRWSPCCTRVSGNTYCRGARLRQGRQQADRQQAALMRCAMPHAGPSVASHHSAFPLFPAHTQAATPPTLPTCCSGPLWPARSGPPPAWPTQRRRVRGGWAVRKSSARADADGCEPLPAPSSRKP